MMHPLTWKFLGQIVIRLLVLVIFAMSTILAISWVFPKLIDPYWVKWIPDAIIVPPFERWIAHYDPAKEYFKESLTYIYIGIFGILAALLTIIISTSVSRQNQRKQSTTDTLMESRFSEHFQKLNERFLPLLDRKKAVLSAKDRRNLLPLLNYYEFLSVGIVERNLDEVILEKSIRGHLCRATYISRTIINEIRVEKGRETSYENLVAVYWKWVDESRPDEWDKSMPDLGPAPHRRILKCHEFWLSQKPFWIFAAGLFSFIVIGQICRLSCLA